MKIRSILFAALFATAALASAQTFKPERKYVEGDKDTYTMKVNATTQMGDVQLSMDMYQTVKKLYENGDADIESNVSNLTLNVGGNEMHPPTGQQKPTVTRFTKFGQPVETAATPRNGMNFSRFGSYFGDKELKVGDVVTFDQKDEKNPKNHSAGTVKLLSIENDKAKLSLTVDNFIEGTEKPMHIDGTVTVSATNGKLLRFEGKAKDLPGAGGMSVSAADFVMEKK
jgi:hypothetical protein